MREIGIGTNADDFDGIDATFATQNFGRPRSDRFLTGAAYSEHDGDDFDLSARVVSVFVREDTAQLPKGLAQNYSFDEITPVLNPPMRNSPNRR